MTCTNHAYMSVYDVVKVDGKTYAKCPHCGFKKLLDVNFIDDMARVYRTLKPKKSTNIFRKKKWAYGC